MITLPDFKGLREAGPAVQRELLAIASRRRLDVDHLAALIQHESGWNPKAENPASHAVGLIQFMPSTAKGLATTVDALRAMTTLEQLAYVEKYFEHVCPHGCAPRDIAMAGFLPSRIGHPDSEVAFERGTVGYTQNAALDRDKDGRILLGEVRDDIDKVLFGRARFVVDEAPAPSSSPAKSSGGSVLGLIGLAIAGFLAAIAGGKKGATT